MCGPGDSLTAGTDGLSAIDAMYSLFAALLGHGDWVLCAIKQQHGIPRPAEFRVGLLWLGG